MIMSLMQIMDNHANREEIKEALKDGYGGCSIL